MTTTSKADIPEHLAKFTWYAPHLAYLWGDLSGKKADLRGADLSGAELPHLVFQVVTDLHSATHYPDGRLTYGCETLQVGEWPGKLEELLAKHKCHSVEKHRRDIEALLAYCAVAIKGCAESIPKPEGEDDD